MFDATTGNLLRTFNNPTPASGDRFGQSVSVDGNNVLVGARLDDTGVTIAGSAYLFDATTGNLLQIFNNPTPTTDISFSFSVSIDGNNVLVGAHTDDTNAINAGSAYLFDATTGNLLQTFNNPTPATDDFFSFSVSVDGNNVLVGAHFDDTAATNAGSAYLFDATTGNLLQTFNSPTPESADGFGSSVSVDGNNVLVGAFRDVVNAAQVGSAYLFDATDAIEYTPNLDFNGIDSFDYTITDGEFSDSATVSVIVTPVNDVPVANDDTEVTPLNNPIDIPVLENDSDVEDGIPTITSVTSTLEGIGTAEINPAGTGIIFTPNLDTFGTDTFQYTVSDIQGLTATATVTVTVTEPEEAPAIVSITADDPDSGDGIFGAGDTITVIFSVPTNTPAIATKLELDSVFTFQENGATAILGIDYTGFFIDPSTLIITIVDPASATLSEDSIDAFTMTVKPEADLRKQGNVSLASTPTSPQLTGSFGFKEGPSILSIEASNSPVTPAPFYSNGDTITVTFSEATNRPKVDAKVDLDKLFTFSPSIGDKYVGSWLSPSVLVITVLDIDEVTELDLIGILTLKVNADGDLRNEAGTSSQSISQSPSLVGDFGQKAGPLITSIRAADPAPIDDAVFGNGDTITVRFSEATNQPAVTTTQDLDNLFTFSQSLGTSYTGVFVNPQTLVITIVDSTGATPPVVGEFFLTVNSGAGIPELRAADGSEPSTPTSPLLVGTFGNKPGPFITSLVALDPFASTPVFGNGDTITVTFSEATNEPFKGTGNQLSKVDLDTLFSYTQGPDEFREKFASLGGDYRGEYTDPLTLVITFTTTFDSIVSQNSIGDLRFEVQPEGNLRDAVGTSLVSVSPSPPLEGTFETRDGPSILSIEASDSPLTPATGFSNGDTITVKFSEATNEPDVETQANLDTLFTFLPPLVGAELTGNFIDPETLILTTINSGTTDPQPGEFTISVTGGDLRSGTGTSLASDSTSPALVGDFGQKAGPSIRAIVADDPDNSDSIFSNEDTITVKFSEPTNQPAVATKADLDRLFIFSQSIGDDYSGEFTLPSTLVITIVDSENLEVPPEVGVLTVTVRDSGDLQAATGSLPSTAVSPPLSGTFGTFIEVIPVTDGGSAFTKLPAGTTSELSLSAGVSTTVTTVRVDESQVSDSLPSPVETQDVTVDFAGDVIDIVTTDDKGCTVDNPCTVAFTFTQDDFDAILTEAQAEIAALIAAGETVTVISLPTTPFDVKIFHDKNDDGDFSDVDDPATPEDEVRSLIPR